MIIIARKARPDLTLSEEWRKYDLVSRTIYLGIPQSMTVRMVKGIPVVMAYLFKDSKPVLRSFNMFRYGRQALSFSLFYQVIPFLGTKEPFDILHCQFGPLGLHGLRIKEIIGQNTKLVTSFRGFDASKSFHKKPNLYKNLFEAGDLFLPVSQSLKYRIMEQGCAERKIIVLPSGIDCQQFPFSIKTFPENEPVKVITVARLVEKKGIAYAIEAVHRVIQSGRVITYTIIGDGDLRGELEKMIKQRNLTGQIRLLGWKRHREVIQTLEESHILLAPSITAQDGDQEGIPNAIKEGMAMGMPVIGTRHSGIPELIDDGVSGFLVGERNVDELFQRLCDLIDHPEWWEKLGKAGRTKIEQEYSKGPLSKRLLNIYQNLCENEPGCL